jgi:CheY-like chemotaxis protein
MHGTSLQKLRVNRPGANIIGSAGCVATLPVLVVETDPDFATLIFKLLWDAGIADADLAHDPAAAEKLGEERDYDAVILCASMLGATNWVSAPDDLSDDPRALIVLLDEPLPAGTDLPLGVVALPRSQVGTRLVACLQKALQETGRRCKAHSFCRRDPCPRGF